MPSTNVDYWKNKIERNIHRDNNCLHELKTLGWQALIIWECELKDLDHLKQKLSDFLALTPP